MWKEQTAAWKARFYLTFKIFDKIWNNLTKLRRSFSPWNSAKLCYTHWNFHDHHQNHWKLHMIFSWSSLYSFLTNLWKFYMLFLRYRYPEFSGIIKNIWKYYFRGISKSFSSFIKVGILPKEIYNTMCVRVRCFKNEFSELTRASSPQTSPGLIVLDSMVKGSLTTVILRPSTK